MSARRTLTTDLLPDCPRCGSPVALVLDGMIGTPSTIAKAFTARDVEPAPVVRWRLAAFGACTGCELCIEIQPKGSAS